MTVTMSYKLQQQAVTFYVGDSCCNTLDYVTKHVIYFFHLLLLP